MNTNTSKTMMTVNSVAKRLGRSAAWVREMATSGDLPGMRVGDRGHWRFSPDDVEAFIDKHMNGAAKAS